MSWNISLAAKGKDEAKSQLAEKSAECGGHMPQAVTDAISGLIEAMPDTLMDGYNTLSVSSYGHFRADDQRGGTSNLTIAIQQVAD